MEYWSNAFVFSLRVTGCESYTSEFGLQFLTRNAKHFEINTPVLQCSTTSLL
jgi:hypothetical protein